MAALFTDGIAREIGEDFYSLLGCDESSSCEQITKEYHIRAKVYHPDRISDEEERLKAESMFTKLNRAHEILSNEETRQSYDSWRRSGLKMPFDDWLGLHKRMKPSLHFRDPPKQLSLPADRVDPQTESQEKSKSKEHFQSSGSAHSHIQFRSGNTNYNSSLLKQFRTYKI